MSVSLPRPPAGLKLDPDLEAYLRDLLQYIEAALNDHEENFQRKGDPVIVPQAKLADLLANPGRYRAGQESRLVFCPDAATSGALALSFDYTAGGLGPVWHEITLGPKVGP